MTRAEQIRDKLAASLKDDGKPKRGYTLRVAALRRELSNLELATIAALVPACPETTRLFTSEDLVGVDTASDQP